MKIIRKIKWLLNGKPVLKYSGFCCGLCGKWVDREFAIPEWRSCGTWWDTWGMCDECGEGHEEGVL